MSKMKHLFRKLHIGGGGGGLSDQHQRLPEPRPHNSPSLSSAASSVPASPAPRARAAPDPAPVEVGRGGGGDGLGDFSFFEEEFQVQLALAISASDPDARQDAESVQIDAAKRISLGCPVGSPVTNYDIVNYDERVMDGFYDVYGIISNENFLQGKLPSLVDLQAISISDNVDYEVVLVNRTVDPALQQLERTAQSIALECRAADLGPIGSGLVQKIAYLVVDSMGGPVGDAEDMLRRWRTRSHELRTSLKTIVLPLGCLDIGLSRHRALLFKVLADKTGLPCRLVKGSFYTGTDEGAVNLIKVDQDCEYIIDLMGAPGALIPAEVPCTQLQTATFDILSSTAISHSVKDLCSVLDEKLNCNLPQNSGGLLGSSCCSSSVPTTVVSSVSADAAEAERLLTESNQTAKFERDFGNLLPLLGRSREESSGNKKVRSSTQKMKVKDVSKYVISAAQNPEFAQKLHAVLLESGASPPPDLFSDINLQHDLVDAKEPRQICMEEANKTKEKPQVGSSFLPRAGCKSSALADCGNEQDFYALEMSKNHISAKPGADVGHGCKINVEGLDNPWIHYRSALTSRCGEEYYEIPVQRCGSENEMTDYVACKENGYLPKRQDTGQDCTGKLVEVDNDPQLSANEASINNRNPLLDDVGGYEIPWEDLQLGERIGLGSFGEVYHADLNGTEVAVKKFLVQDFSGDALEQFRSEIKIMLRLRHPNVVLFMGAVTRPPNLSILTEFLPRGSLYRLLHRPKIQLDEKRRLKMALDVAKGMNYLHTSHPTIVHRDLKSPNLLVGKNWVVKVCDFGLSRLKHHTFLSSKSTAGTPEWMAPEVLRNELSNEKCDVYSFGVILWELATLRMPWSGMNPMQVVGAVGFQNRRLDIPKEVDSMVAQIILDCWHSEPNLRPSFSQLMGPLKQLKRLVTEET